VFRNLSSRSRKKLHMLCDRIGLHHESKISSINECEKIFYAYKPDVWLWEYTEENPYTDENHNVTCYNCGRKRWMVELFVSPHIDGIYCEDCLDIVSDGGGDYLSAHKFEPYR
jgi:hypothetical protein